MAGSVRRCLADYSAQVRCELPAGHVGDHAHSFFARYWPNDGRCQSHGRDAFGRNGYCARPTGHSGGHRTADDRPIRRQS